MIIDLDQRDAGEVIECDLCIAGSGAAGLSIALQFIDQRNLDVVVLEGGGRDFSAASQEMYRGPNLGFEYYDLDASRLRYLGGSTNHWGGWCRPLDPMDFEALPWVPHSGWPIGPEDLSVHRSRAHDILDLGQVEYGAEKLVARLDGFFSFNPKLLEHKVWRFSTPTNFGTKYAAGLDRSTAVRVYLNANVTNVELTADGRRAVGLDVRTTGDKRLRVRSRNIVLAMGGLETARILLNSDSQAPKGVGNEHDLVGRYFMEHPHVESAHLVLGERIDTGYAYSHDRQIGTDGHSVTPGVCVTDAARRRFKILNHSATTGLRTHRETSRGYQAWLGLTGKGNGSEDKGTWQDIKALIDDIDGAAVGLYNDVFEDIDVAPQRAWLYTRCEQAPNPESRVVLTDQVDRLGLRRIGLDWRLTALDKHTIRTASKIFAREIGRLGLGRARLPRWLRNKDADVWFNDDDPEWRRLRGGNHHMGTTRMAQDERSGVVDKDCRVHGVENLYIAGSSVFPTCGFANPTLTIVELALRLADHLKQAP